jgi:Ca2+/Na+ antiporter
MEFEIITYTFATYLVIFLLAYFLRKKFNIKENENIETNIANEEDNNISTSNKKKHYVIVSLIVITTIALTFFRAIF